MSARPLLWPALGFLAGVTLGLWPFSPPAWVLLLVPAVLVPRLSSVAFLALGWLAAAATRSGPCPVPTGLVAIAGVVVTAPERLDDRVRFRVERADGLRVEVTAEPLPHPLALGDTVLVSAAELTAPPGPRNPGGRDLRARLAAAGTPFLARARGVVVRTAPPAWTAWLERARGRFGEACARFLPPREAALLRAIGTGDRAALDRETTAAFARSGLAHVLAVSGLHLVVVVFGACRLLRAGLLRWDAFAARVDPRRAAAVLSLGGAFLYALATGANAPVLRAAIGAAVALGGEVLQREGDALNGLALAALALLAGEPAVALDPSFQLSFAAVGGLALWSGPLRARLPVPRPRQGTWRARLVEPVLGGVCATAAASLATAPVLAFHFRQLPLLGVVANLGAIPIGSALTALAATAWAAACASPVLAAPFLLAARPLAAALAWLADAAAAPRWGALPLGSPGFLPAAAAGVLLVLAGRARPAWPGPEGRRLGVAAARSAAALAAVLCLGLPAPLRAVAAGARGGLEVTFLSVGQGDAALLRLPDGAAVLVDGGGAPEGGIDPGARDVVPLLRDLGVRRLAAVFVSHPHPDHALGLDSVAEAFPVDAAFGNGDPGAGPVAAVLARLRAQPFPPRARWERAGVQIESVGGAGLDPSGNDGSLVLRITYGVTTFLFAGDIEGPAEAAALAAAGDGGLRADVVKAPHHCSSTSSTPAFVAAVRPRFAVCSLGLGNRFSFPHPGPVARWRAAGAEVLRTDEGAIRFLSDGARLSRVPADRILDPLATLAERP
jgi:competence protein ComEC